MSKYLNTLLTYIQLYDIIYVEIEEKFLPRDKLRYM